MPRLETARLLLRRWQMRDVDDLFEYARHPEVGPSAAWMPHPNRQYSLQMLAGVFMEEDTRWAIEHKELRKVIGAISLHDDAKRTAPNTLSLGYSLSHDFWGQGLMSEAAPVVVAYGFEQLCLDLISCYHFEGNERSRRIIEKCGFTFEGILRHCNRVGEKIHHDYCYSMTREEYFTRRSQDRQTARP
ncbi:MAG: GNAT family N-acetyltransferase [Lentisphaerae bacterium]|nr:GNAT family N-acetyltransferase [Lentisphaerota bacterium]OQC17098.1 MAG: putative ribosomal N-acetyltransferase YdaF [Lentisphaerae bacterium ADurb.Bin082]